MRRWKQQNHNHLGIVFWYHFTGKLRGVYCDFLDQKLPCQRDHNVSRDDDYRRYSIPLVELI